MARSITPTATSFKLTPLSFRMSQAAFSRSCHCVSRFRLSIDRIAQSPTRGAGRIQRVGPRVGKTISTPDKPLALSRVAVARSRWSPWSPPGKVDYLNLADDDAAQLLAPAPRLLALARLSGLFQAGLPPPPPIPRTSPPCPVSDTLPRSYRWDRGGSRRRGGHRSRLCLRPGTAFRRALGS